MCVIKFTTQYNVLIVIFCDNLLLTPFENNLLNGIIDLILNLDNYTSISHVGFTHLPYHIAVIHWIDRTFLYLFTYCHISDFIEESYKFEIMKVNKKAQNLHFKNLWKIWVYSLKKLGTYYFMVLTNSTMKHFLIGIFFWSFKELFFCSFFCVAEM